MDIDVRLATEEDIPVIMKIENSCFTHPWSEADVRYDMFQNPVGNFIVLTCDDVVCGFASYWKTFDSATIAQIAVDPNHQRRHFADTMMEDILSDCFAKKIKSLVLEVRESNFKAINFYTKHGFKKEVIKPHYYTDGENAIYMIKEVQI